MKSENGILEVYHAGTEKVEAPNCEVGRINLDFGKGFYLTPDRNTAIRMAQKKARIFGGTPTLITYDMDDVTMHPNLKIKEFPKKACSEWFLFIDANRDRNNTNPIHDYDIVIGPIADDGVVLQLTNFREGIYSSEEAARLLQDRYLDQQYFFGTERALSIIKKIKSENV